MSDAYIMPSRKTEQAFRRFIIGQTGGTIDPATGVLSAEGHPLDGVQVLTRFSGAAIREPRLSIVCKDATNPTPDTQQSSCWLVDVSVSVVSHYEKSPDVDGAAHDVLAGTVFDMLQGQDDGGNSLVPTVLNAVSAEERFTALAWVLRGISESQEGHSYKTELTGQLEMWPDKQGE